MSKKIDSRIDSGLDSNIAPSLTKGIFVKKPAKKQKYASRYIEPFHYEQYKLILCSMEEKIQDIEKCAYKETFDSLTHFVKNCHSARIPGVHEIPSAILVMGVNMPDHSNIFKLLENQLNSEGVFGTVKLESKECNSFANLMQKLVKGIVTKFEKERNSDDVSLRKQECTFSKLLSYYENLPGLLINKASGVRQSPRKTPTKGKTQPLSLKSKPMVILIQDVEAFDKEILQELILNCSLYATKLPLVLVFGMASAMVTLHNILSQRALSCLGIETFYSLTAIEYLTKILHQVVLSPENPFKLGPKVYRLIVDTVLYHDFSVSNLRNMLKFCLMEHFYDNDVACLCCSQGDISNVLLSLSDDEVEKFRSLQSFSQILDNNPECGGKIKKTNFKVLLEDLLSKQHSHYKMIIVYLNCLHVLTKDLPGQPLGKHLRELYPLAFEDNLTLIPSYQQAIKLLKFLSKEDLQSKLKSCIDILREVDEPNTEIIEAKDLLISHYNSLSNLTEDDKEKQPAVKVDDTEKITSRSQLQERLRQQLKSKRSKYENCRDSIVDFITSLFQKMHSPTKLPLHEVLYFDNVVSMKQHLMAMPRINLHKDLINPHAQLQCSCCKVSDVREIGKLMPDICILYKLHLESGKLINLYDWLQAFKAVKGVDKENSDGDKEINIRFMHSVSELQHLGFIKSTKRKTDHVARLTFTSV